MSQTIAFNADDRQKILVEVLAKRLGYKNVSDMLRAWIDNGITENISADEQTQILSFYAPKHGSESRSEYETKHPKQSRRR
jgi:hypothetical protein